ncbi:MAG: ABC transporter permease [Sediminibacterium sp.]|nr:ABC transporter permease [Sediminibacterium sp.]
MNKFWLVLMREYTSRVTKKSFILLTILMPIIFVGFIFLVGYIQYIAFSGSDVKKIAIYDPANFLNGKIQDKEKIVFTFDNSVDSLNYLSKNYNYFISISPNNKLFKPIECQMYYEKELGFVTEEKIRNSLTQSYENILFNKLGISQKKLDSIYNIANGIDLKTFKRQESGELKESNSAVATTLGYGAGFFIYFTLFLYGTLVMRGVTEEKTNRISEVILSSVKPFQLMLAKIIGIGMVGLTQFIIWLLFFGFILVGINLFLPPELQSEIQHLQQISNLTDISKVNVSETSQQIYRFKTAISTVNWPLIISCFVFYFLGGYFFYASLFAAIGSASGDDPQDAQTLIIPVSMIIVVSLMIMISASNEPSTALAIWGSIIPFSAPLVMMARVAYGVPEVVTYTQLISSMVLLIFGILFTSWVGAKIYRYSILMYGKKFNLKELGKIIIKK